MGSVTPLMPFVTPTVITSFFNTHLPGRAIDEAWQSDTLPEATGRQGWNGGGTDDQNLTARLPWLARDRDDVS